MSKAQIKISFKNDKAIFFLFLIKKLSAKNTKTIFMEKSINIK